jgi:hypothetical protein
MIELITNGALPKPGKCICCGYSGNDRNYFRFQAFIPRLGQVLLCTAKDSKPGSTGCMNEAARRFPVSFVESSNLTVLSTENDRLKRENERLGVATNEFTDSFAALVSHFLANISSGDEIAPTPDRGFTKVGSPEATNPTSRQAINITLK